MFARGYRWAINNAQLLINVYLFVNILGVILWQVHGLYQHGRLDFIEITFILNNCALAWVVLIRQRHIAVDRNVWHQGIALVAFFSGVAFISPSTSNDPLIASVSAVILLAASVLGLISVFNLRDSFGILIACRTIKTQGLYRYVRHPMYATDILLRVGYLVSHCTVFTIILFAFSTACYVYRAILEEEFLCAQSDVYRSYKASVRYRFIPGLI